MGAGSVRTGPFDTGAPGGTAGRQAHGGGTAQRGDRGQRAECPPLLRRRAPAGGPCPSEKYRIVWSCVLIAAFISLAVLWWKGVFHIVERLESPDGTCLLTIYDRDVAIDRLSREPAVTVVNRMPEGAYTTTVYGGAAFQGAWWSPDSTKYILAFETNKGTQLVLNHMIGHSASNLNAYLSMGVDWGELSDRAPQYPEEGVFPDVAYQFLQWSLDSQSALIYYSFSDTDGTRHEGYFWYNCETGTVTGTLKLQAS